MVGVGDMGLLSQPDPVVLQLKRLQSLLKEKERELGFAQSEIKALKAADVLKEKSLEEMGYLVEKLDSKLSNNENLLHQKNLDIKKLVIDKKEALAAQFAAEATLRRVHANQKEDNSVPIESIIAPLEADIRMYKNEITALQEDKKTLERHTKSKETALLEAERILTSALERALIVEEVQNQNIELRRQIEICNEENKIMEKTNRKKVLEVEKLSETIKELEEAILAGGAAANTIRDYRRQIYQLQEEKRTLERELARATVSANRVATTVANEWKDGNDKLMPVKQWLEERRLLQAELQRLKDKLSISERTAKNEAQLKEKLKLRLKTLEDGLKHGSPQTERSNHYFQILSINKGKKRSTSQPRGSFTSSQKSDDESETKEVNVINKKYASGENFLRIGLRSDRDEKQNNENIPGLDNFKDDTTNILRGREGGNDGRAARSSDLVSGFLYDKLQKEVISLRKCCGMKDSRLNEKDEENKVLMKKLENLLQAESKKWKRDAAAGVKSTKTDEQKQKRRAANHPFEQILKNS